MRKIYQNQDMGTGAVHGRGLTEQQFGWAEIRGCLPEFRMVHKSLVLVDDRYQRELLKGNAAIAAKFNWVAFMAVPCSERPDGSLYAMDGQQRTAAACMRSDIQKIPALVYRLSGYDEEAEVAMLINSRRKGWSALQRFKNRTAWNDKNALIIRDFLVAHGWGVGEHARCVVACITTFESCYFAYGHEVMESVLDIAENCHEGVIKNDTCQGLAILESRLRKEHNDSILKYRDKLGSFEECTKAIRTAAAVAGKRSPNICARALLDRVNYRRSTGRINIDFGAEG